jgi:hypothetical protein
MRQFAKMNCCSAGNTAALTVVLWLLLPVTLLLLAAVMLQPARPLPALSSAVLLLLHMAASKIRSTPHKIRLVS